MQSVAYEGTYVIFLVFSDVYSPSEWTAIEEFTGNIITVKSDVWSYGVLLTELLSDGAVPYANVLGISA